MLRRCLVLATTLLVALPALAQAAPTATDDASYGVLGRVFPDPQAICGGAGAPGCSPNAQGNVNATTFVGFDEFLSSMKYLNSKPAWRRYLEVLPLDGKLGDGAGTTPGDAMFPGNDMGKLEFTPDKAFHSAGLATTDGGKAISDVMVVRVTDETVPDAGKKRYALDLSIHGIERAGVEGGLRTIEDLVTAATTPGKAGGSSLRIDDKLLPDGVLADGGPSFREALQHTVIYFTFPNPDGWRRGSVTQFGPLGDGGVFFQRYNGNGVDVNRDWPDIGYAFRPYSALSEPESRALSSFYNQVKQTTGSEFAAGDDLHGQPEADALSYTLLPHGSHTYAKDLRIRETAKLINRATYAATSWSPIIQDNDQPVGGGVPCTPSAATGSACAQIYAQTWGSVYDTINYTTTGAIGDWFDSSVGLNADGIDNEMSFSHLDKNIVFEPNTEQLHVDGNKFLIYAHLARMLEPVQGTFDAPGKKGYVANTRVVRAAKDNAPIVPPGTSPSPDFDTTATGGPTGATVEFPVKRDATTYNGGFRVDVRTTNLAGVGTGMATLSIQCKGCDDHPGVEPDEDGFITVTEDYNQSFVYLQAGVTAAVNFPQSTNRDGEAITWRAVVGGTSVPGPLSVHVEYSSGPATIDGDTGKGDPPKLRAYDVANTDFFAQLKPFAPKGSLDAIDPREVIAGRQGLDAFDSIVLADAVLPGYVPAAPAAGGATTPDVTFDNPDGTTTDHPFSVSASDPKAKAVVHVEWDSPSDDYDLEVFRKTDAGETPVGESAGSPPGTSEEVTLTNPPAGEYVARVTNFNALLGGYTGSVTFTGAARGARRATGAYSDADYATWTGKLKAWVQDGGNLVLTDAALQGLPALTGVGADKVAARKVYAGQVAFSTDGSDDTLDDPLAKDVAQPGARFNAGMRRQTYEPTPLGIAIQDDAGADAFNAPQWDVEKAAFTAAGGRIAATSASNRDVADNARVALGEIPVGKGDVRIAGALLPQPTEAFDHPQGLEPHATTYTGYILWRNLLEVTPRTPQADPGTPTDTTPTPTDTTSTETPPASTTPADGTPATTGAQLAPGVLVPPAGGGAVPGGTAPDSGSPAVCAATAGFRTAGVARSGRGLRLAFTRRLQQPVRVDVFRTSAGRTVVKERLVARFTGRSASFAWDGRPTTKAGVGDGSYIVRMTLGTDVRRFAVQRRGGRFSLLRPYYAKAGCAALQAFKLERPVFGGTAVLPLRVSYRLARSARVALTVTRGGKVVKRVSAARSRGAYRLALPAARLARGRYDVRLVVTPARGAAITRTLSSTRI